MDNAIQEKKSNLLALPERITKEQKATLALRGLHPAVFQETLTEAILNNPKIPRANYESLTRALRECCQSGMLPNGRDSALIVNGDGSVKYLQMRDGIAKLFHRLAKGSEIRSNYVRDGESVTVTTDSVEGDRVTTSVDFGAELGEVIGSWCVITVPGYKPFAHVFDRNDIAAARAASSVKGQGGPWDKWTGRMAEKAVVKSAVRKALYMFDFENTVARDDVIEILNTDDRNEVEEESVIIEHQEKEPEVAPAPVQKKKAKPKPKAEPKQIESSSQEDVWADPKDTEAVKELAQEEAPPIEDDDIDLPDFG